MGVDHATLTATESPIWLAPWCDWLNVALHREVLRLRVRYELSVDEFHGLYVSHAQVDQLLLQWDEAGTLDFTEIDAHRTALLASARDQESPLADLARRLSLADTDLVTLMACLAPEIDLSYQTLYAYLNDDVTRKLPSVDLCQRMGGHAALDQESAVIRLGLVESERVPTAPLWRSAGLVLADPVRRYLLGLDRLAASPGRWSDLPELLVLEGGPDDALEEAERLLGGRTLVVPDEAVADTNLGLRDVLLRARLHGVAAFVPGTMLGLGRGVPAVGVDLERWSLMARAGVPVVVAVRPGQATQLPLAGVDHDLVTVGRLLVAERQDRWLRALGESGVGAEPGAVTDVAAMFTLGSAQIRAAAASVAREGDASYAALSRAARRTSSYGLAGVAERVPANFVWDDLVLPHATEQRLRELSDAIRYRHQVFGDWEFGRLSGGHTSVRALLSGPSGTGKTMSASVLAAGLGLDLYRVDLSQAVSKYIGETEKNLERVLNAAEDSNAILLFDEADALFGKRSEVKDAHDRYANIEVAYLLQRIESFDGVILLATNLSGNLDDAFSRRLQFQIEFPAPDVQARADLWRKAFPAAAPVSDDLDILFLAGIFSLTGGEIRSCVLAAAFMAARENEGIGMRHIVQALAQFRRQQGKLPSASEFGEHMRLVRFS